ncbi:MAG: MFS transporter [Janthinobacterium lividum]
MRQPIPKSSDKPERSLRAHQTVTLSLLFLAGVVNFFDRSSLSIANTTVRAELHLSNAQMGWLLSAFSLAYGLTQLPLIGWLDRLGTRKMLGAGLTVWSGAQLLTATVRSFPMFIVFRVLLGAGESPFYPAGIRSMREWFTPKTRGRATALMSSSQTFGLAAAPPLLTLLMLHIGWRGMFAVLGVAGLLVAVLWMWLHQPRSATPFREPVTAALGTGNIYRTLLSQRTVWGMMLGFGGVNYTAWLYISWLPGYFQAERGLSLAKSGWFAAIPFLAGAAGMLASGFCADALVARGLRLTSIHRAQIVLGMVLSAAASLFASRSTSTSAALLSISFAFFWIQFGGTSGWGYVQAVSPPHLTAALGALQNFASFLIASAAPVLTGMIVDRTHSFTLAFATCSAVTLLGALSYATLAAPSGMRITLDA